MSPNDAICLPPLWMSFTRHGIADCLDILVGQGELCFGTRICLVPSLVWVIWQIMAVLE